MGSKPFELIVSPFEVFVAPVGETYSLIDVTPAGNWVKLGTSGNKNMGEEGVTVNHDQTVDFHRVYGSSGPVKATRSSEDLRISFVLVDLTLEEYTRIINDVTAVDNAESSGVAGFREINLRRGLVVAEVALLVKGDSPYGNNWNMQFEVPRVVQSGSPSPVFLKNAPASLAIEFTALEDAAASSDAARFGRIVSQDAAPL
ncbi:hypothetical protein MYX75_01045 [Acidobacteria bacterium AH-259-A15]|nr:hypothetical protein [Acidobacteria bacterium AH-259-A15]